MNYIKSLSISGFKSIREMKDLELRPLNVLIGANGAGKSNLVSYFRMVNLMVRNALFEYVAKNGYSDSILYDGEKLTSKIESRILMSIRDESYEYSFDLRPYNNLLGIKNEILHWTRRRGDTEAPGIQFGTADDTTQSSLNDIKKRKAYPRIVPVWDYISNFGVFQFNDTTGSSKIRKKSLVNDNKSVFEDGGNLSAILYYLKEKEGDAYESIIEKIRLVYPAFEDFIILPERLNRDFLDWRWKEMGKSYELRSNQFSDGTLRFMALVTLLGLPKKDMPSLVIIDEPELGLHPRAVTILCELLKAASVSTQIIISTQSPSIIDEMDPPDVIVVEREDNQSVFKHLDEKALEEWLTDYSLGELWQKNLLGGNPR